MPTMTDESTKVTFDLSKELTEKELESFKREAKKAQADTLTDHFLNITIRKPEAIT